jgi:hypothetical protein
MGGRELPGLILTNDPILTSVEMHFPMRLCHAAWRSKMNPIGPIKEREVAPSACDSFGCCHGWKAGTVPSLDIGAVRWLSATA